MNEFVMSVRKNKCSKAISKGYCLKVIKKCKILFMRNIKNSETYNASHRF